MARFDSPLDSVKVAAPCSADWDKMVGDERARFCQSCELNVYNLSGMSRAEAERLVAGAEGRVCVRFYRRADGTILTGNCPVGLRALKQRLARFARATVSAALGFLAGLGLAPARRYEVMGEMVYDPAPVRSYEIMGGIGYEPAPAKHELMVEVPAPEYPADVPVAVDVPPQAEDVGWMAGRLMTSEVDAVNLPRKAEGRRDRRR